LHLAPPSTTEHNETRKSPAKTWPICVVGHDDVDLSQKVGTFDYLAATR
jgi:hypothetical protein